MIRRFLLIFALVFAPLGAAFAAAAPRDCTLQTELIFEMMKAEYGAYNVWDAEYGERNTDEKFASGVVIDSGNVVAVSELGAFGKPDRTIQLVEFDNRGRVVWEKAQPVKDLAAVKKMLIVPTGFAVLGWSQDKNARISVWIGFFDKTGKLLSEKTISDGASSLVPDDLIVRTGEAGFLLSASSGSPVKGIFHAVLYHLDAKGNVQDKHAYRPGLDNRILSLSPDGKDYYIGAGYLRGEDGRTNGWLMQLNKDGSLVWQQEYPRGAMAQLNKAIPMVKNYILATGDVKPLGRGNLAAWVMMINRDTGAMIWQRYYTADLNQSGRDLLVNMEGLASVMVQVSKPPDMEASEDTEDFVRLLTINERGILFMSDEYFNAAGAQGAQLIGGRAGERIVTGRTDMVYKIDPKPGEPVETLQHGWDGWVIAASPMESYPDPCLNIDPFSP